MLVEAQDFKLRDYVTSRDNWQFVGTRYIDEKPGATTDRSSATVGARPGYRASGHGPAQGAGRGSRCHRYRPP